MNIADAADIAADKQENSLGDGGKPTGVPNVSEDVLVDLARQGDHMAFTTLLELHDKQVMRLILRFSGNQYDRDDLYQEIFTACYVSLPGFTGKSAFFTWLYRIALNHCITYMKKRKPVESAKEIPVSDINWEKQEKLRTVFQALNKLKGAQRISFHLFYVEQWTVTEISEVLECTVGTIKSHLDRARKRIRLDEEVAKW